MNRRSFLQSTGAGAAFAGTPPRKQKLQSWPVFDEREDKALLQTLRSGKWYRGTGDQVAVFEKAYAQLMGSKGCLATANGTSALLASLAMIGIGPGDEVIITPYTFVATVNAILQLYAVPVFADVDLET